MFRYDILTQRFREVRHVTAAGISRPGWPRAARSVCHGTWTPTVYPCEPAGLRLATPSPEGPTHPIPWRGFHPPRFPTRCIEATGASAAFSLLGGRVVIVRLETEDSCQPSVSVDIQTLLEA